jgi:hypothetical protein
MGYYCDGKSDQRRMLTGEITTSNVTFPSGGPSTLTVRALNLLHRFRTEPISRPFIQKKDSDIANDLVDEIDKQIRNNVPNIKLQMDEDERQANLARETAMPYLGIQNSYPILFPDEVTKLCNAAPEPNDKPGPDGLADVDHFARFVRASKAPPPDFSLEQSPTARRGSDLFDKIGCAVCHARSMTTAPTGTRINGGTYTVPAVIGGKAFHPFSDFLLHDVGTGDGIVVPTIEHYGHSTRQMPRECSPENFQRTQNRIRTAPLWGLRLRSRLMHDGASVNLRDSILRHGGEANEAARDFRRLPARDQESVLAFLSSL